MMQTQWPGLGPSFDLSSLDAASGDGRRLWPGDGPGPALPAQPSQTPDAVMRPWWNCGTGAANAGDPFGGLLGGANGAGGGTLVSLVSGLVTMLQQLVGTLLNQGGGAAQGGGANQGGGFGGTGGQQPWLGGSQPPCASGGTQPCEPGRPHPWAAGGPQQRFADADVSSTGDPHIATTGTRESRGGDQAVDERWDSMTSHADLVHSNEIEGGYRVSTAVTQPGANGVTSNESATVRTNFGQDEITMRRDGSFAIYDDGREVALGKGESATLSGGERVTANQDGSLVVNASNAHGGTIATTLRATGAGVDVTTHAHEIALGGDAVTHGTPPKHTMRTHPAPGAPAAPAAPVAY